MVTEAVYLHPDDYDLELASRNVGDIPFWLNLVQSAAPSRILEIGCGTGRLTLPLGRAGAAKGFHVTGLEMETPMLARARERLRAEPQAVQDAIRLVKGDVRSMKLDDSFDLVLLPYGVAHHLLRVDDQVAAWRAIRRHLHPEGLLCVDVGAPDVQFMGSVLGEAQPRKDMDATDRGGRHLRRTVTSHYSAATQLMTHRYEYESMHPDGTKNQYVSQFDMHVYFPRELQLLCRLTGFSVEHLFGSYQGEPFTDGSEFLIMLARPSMRC